MILLSQFLEFPSIHFFYETMTQIFIVVSITLLYNEQILFTVRTNDSRKYFPK